MFVRYFFRVSIFLLFVLVVAFFSVGVSLTITRGLR